MVKFWGLKYIDLKKALNLTLFAWKWRWWRLKNICSKHFHERYLFPQTTADFTPRVSKSYVPFYMLSPYGDAFCAADSSQAMQVQNHFLCFSYDKTSSSFRFFHAVFIEKF